MELPIPFADLGYTLRPIEERDLPSVLNWRNSQRIRDCMFTDHVISPEEHRGWFKHLSSSDSTHCFILEYAERPIGLANVFHMNPLSGKCSWGIYLGEVDVPRGSGKIFAFLVLQYIFDRCGKRKVSAEVLATNDISLKFHRTLGFTQEGTLRQHVFKTGVYLDLIVFSMLASEWAEQKDKLLQSGLTVSEKR